MKDQGHRRLIGVTILLGYLLFFLGDIAVTVEAASKHLGRIRVEDRPGFTRIVFPCDRPENSSVEPDLERSRFVVRLQATATGVTPPSLAEGHHLIKRIDVLPDPKTGVRVQVILEDNLVDWVSYRYERPPRTVLYLRARSGFGRSKDSTRSSDSQRTGGVTAEKTPPPLTEQTKTRSQPGQASDLAKARSARPVGKGMEGLWRPSAEHIPEFIGLGQVYPPDFPEMKENQRRLYRQALERFRRGDFLGAKECASRIAPAEPPSSLAETLAFFKSDCDFRSGEKRGAKTHLKGIRSYQQAITQFPRSRFVPDAVLAIAKGYRRDQFFQEAMVQYQRFLTEFPGNSAVAEALFWQGECFFQMGKYGEARKIFGEFVEKSPRTIHGRIAALRVGDCFYKMGDLKRARQQYGVVLSESSDLSYYPLRSLFLAGLSFFEGGNFRRGREILFKAVNLDPGSETAMEMMDSIARSYLDENRDEEALRVSLLLGESFGRDGLGGMGYVRLADIRLSRPNLEWPPLCLEAYIVPVGVYQDFLNHCQDMDLADEVMYRKSLALVKRGDIPQAVTTLKKILSQRDHDTLRQGSSSLLTYCLNSLIKGHHGRGEHLEVTQLYRDNADFLFSNDNRDKRGLLLVAETFQKLGLLEDSLSVYRQVKAAPNVAQDHVLFQIGRVLSLKGDKRAARKGLENFQERFPKSRYLSRVQRLLGDLSLDLGDYQDAVKWYRLTVASGEGGPGRGKVYARLGQALRKRGRDREAVEAYQRAIATMWPFREQAWAKNSLGESLAELAVYYDDRGRMPEAVDSYQRIVRLSPSEESVNWALYRLGENYRKMGEMKMMRQTFEDLNKRSADSLWARLAGRTEEDAAFQVEAGPYLAQTRKTPVRTTKE